MDEWIEMVRTGLADNANPGERAAGAEALGWIEVALTMGGLHGDRLRSVAPEVIGEVPREQAIIWLLHRLYAVLAPRAEVV